MRDQTVAYEDAITPEGLDTSSLTRKEFLAINLARHLADNPFRVTDALLAELRQEYTDDEIAEMIFACAIFSWGNIIGIATRVDVEAGGRYKPGMTYEEGRRRKLSSRAATETDG